MVVRAAAMRMRPSAQGPVLAPPCMRQRPFFIAGPLQGQPAWVFAPHRGAAFGLPRGLPLRSVPTGVTGAASGCVGLCAQSSIGGGRTGFRAPSGGATACGTVPRHRSLNGEPWAARMAAAAGGERLSEAWNLFILCSYDKMWQRGKNCRRVNRCRDPRSGQIEKEGRNADKKGEAAKARGSHSWCHRRHLWTKTTGTNLEAGRLPQCCVPKPRRNWKGCPKKSKPG